MTTNLIFGLVGGLVVAVFIAVVSRRSSDPDLSDLDSPFDDAPAKPRTAKRSFFSFPKLGGRRRAAAQPVTRRSEAVAGWRSQVDAACDATGLIKSDAVSWIAPVIMEALKKGYDDHTIASKISGWGNALSEDEKAKMGVRADAKLGREYVEALTRKGRRRPLAAAYFVVQRVTHSHFQAQRLRELCADESVQGVEIVATEGALTCDAAQQVEGRVYAPNKAPPLPLRRCDAEFCRCVYLEITE